MAVRVSRFATIALASLGHSGSVIAQQPPAKIVQAGGSIPEIPPQRVVAYIHGNVPITRDDLADFLITRGGHEKIDLLINRKIIEIECAKRKVTVTPQEMEAQLNEDMKGFEFSRNQFLEQLLPRYNKKIGRAHV